MFTKKKESFNHLPTLCIIDNADTLPPDSSAREKKMLLPRMELETFNIDEAGTGTTEHRHRKR